MRGVRRVLGGAFVVLGVFWAGRESGHGFTAFWEHWWCPLPLVAIVLGATVVLADRLNSSA